MFFTNFSPWVTDIFTFALKMMFKASKRRTLLILIVPLKFFNHPFVVRSLKLLK